LIEAHLQQYCSKLKGLHKSLLSVPLYPDGLGPLSKEVVYLVPIAIFYFTGLASTFAGNMPVTSEVLRKFRLQVLFTSLSGLK